MWTLEYTTKGHSSASESMHSEAEIRPKLFDHFLVVSPLIKLHCVNNSFRARVMAQWLESPATRSGNLSSVSETYMLQGKN